MLCFDRRRQLQWCFSKNGRQLNDVLMGQMQHSLEDGGEKNLVLIKRHKLFRLKGMKNGYLSNVLSQIWQGKGRCKSSCTLWCFHNSDKVSNLELHLSQFSTLWLDLLNPWTCKWPYKLWTFSKVFLQIGHVESSMIHEKSYKIHFTKSVKFLFMI